MWSDRLLNNCFIYILILFIQIQEMKRKAVEKKLEEKQKEEKERIKKEKQHLLTAKREQQGKLKALEQTMELVQVVCWIKIFNSDVF